MPPIKPGGRLAVGYQSTTSSAAFVLTPESNGKQCADGRKKEKNPKESFENRNEGFEKKDRKTAAVSVTFVCRSTEIYVMNQIFMNPRMMTFSNSSNLCILKMSGKLLILF
jgi:hypothetical protein